MDIVGEDDRWVWVGVDIIDDRGVCGYNRRR